MSEHETQSAIIDLINRRGGVAIRVNSGGSIAKRGGRIRLAKKGTSDIIACYNGVFLAIEVKDIGEKATPEQRAFLDSIEDANGYTIVAENIEQVEEILDLIESRLY